LREKQQEKDEQLKAVNQQVNMMQSQMQALITTLGNMDETSKIHLQNNYFKMAFIKRINHAYFRHIQKDNIKAIS
jgi:uncharacterized protein with GYD domain